MWHDSASIESLSIRGMNFSQICMRNYQYSEKYKVLCRHINGRFLQELNYLNVCCSTEVGFKVLNLDVVLNYVFTST